MRRAILLAAAALAPAAVACAEGFSGELELVLSKALYWNNDPRTSGANLLLRLEADDGRWRRVVGTAFDYSWGVHTGVVTEAAIGEAAVTVKVALLTDGDPWNPGDRVAAYLVKLNRGADGGLEGTYEGTFDGWDMTGRATGTIRPPLPIVNKSYVPPAPDEHPRLLFRKYDLPALRAKWRTPFGQAYFRRAVESWDAVSLGVLRHLTGDKKYALEAMKIVGQYQKDVTSTVGIARDGWGTGGMGHRLVAVSAAYDLCCDAWPDDFRKGVEKDLMTAVEYQQKLQGGNWHPCSNWYGPPRGSAAIASLALWGLKGEGLKRPADPIASAVAIPPAADYEPGRGVPVSDFVPGRFPQGWLVAGPVPAVERIDLLDRLGGYAKARPEAGTTFGRITVVDERLKLTHMAFGALPAEAVSDAGIDLTKVVPGGGPSTCVFYTVLNVADEQVVGLARRLPETRVWLGGAMLEDLKYYRLKTGLYPMTVVNGSQKSQDVIGARLTSPGSGTHDPRRARYEMERKLWEHDRHTRQQLGPVDARVLRMVDVGRHQVYQHFRMGVGDGGFAAETGGYAGIATWSCLYYAAMHAEMFGRNVSAHPDATHVIPRHLMQVHFPPRGRLIWQKINSAAGFPAAWVAAALPIVPDEYKPGVLWGWNKISGVTDEASRVNVLPSPRGDAENRGMHLAHAFVNYPPEMEAVHPSKGMPLTWEAPTFGFYCFRSGWDFKEDFIAQVFLKASLIKGWNHPNAGTFRLYGLGHDWAIGPTSRGAIRVQESVVLLPEDEVLEGACGHLSHLATGKDGSGVLTMDMGDVYSGRGKRMLYDRNCIRWSDPERFVASGITGLRAFAFDYSGLCGSPCLMVLVDQIDGGKRKDWIWQFPEGTKEKVRIEGNTFALDYGDASMNATFVAPKDARINIPLKVFGFESHGEQIVNWNVVKAAGGENYFMVATLQRGKPPAVQVAGEGLAAKVTVGRRTIRFDPGPPAKIVLGERAGRQ